MSDIKEIEMNDLEEIVVLEDEEGNELEFALADKIPYGEKVYAVLLPMAEDDGGIVILEYEENDGEEGDLFTDVEDEEILNAVFDLFRDKHAEEFDFVD